MHLTQFIHQKSYEHIVFKIRKHPVTLLPALFALLLLLIVPAGAGFLLRAVFPGIFTNSYGLPLLILFGSVYYLSVALFYYTYFVTFYLDMVIVTNDRLLHIEQTGLFARTISELDLYKIQDMSSEVHGVFASSFNYGNLEIQTAAAVERFRIEDIPNPEGFRQAISELAEEDRKYHSQPIA